MMIVGRKWPTWHPFRTWLRSVRRHRNHWPGDKQRFVRRLRRHGMIVSRCNYEIQYNPNRGRWRMSNHVGPMRHYPHPENRSVLRVGHYESVWRMKKCSFRCSQLIQSIHLLVALFAAVSYHYFLTLLLLLLLLLSMLLLMLAVVVMMIILMFSTVVIPFWPVLPPSFLLVVVAVLVVSGHR